MTYYFPFGVSETKASISHSIAALSSSRPLSSAITVPSAIFAASVINPGAAGTNGTSRSSANCPSTSGTQGAQGATGATGDAGTDKGPGECPSGTKECSALNGDLTALNATLGANDQFGVVCLDLDGAAASTLDCPGALPSGVPTLPSYIQ